jgi:hypothetical protein
MKRKTALILMTALFMATIPVFTSPNASAMPDYEAIRIPPEFRNKDLTIDISTLPSGFGSRVLSFSQEQLTSSIGEVKLWLSLDDYMGYYFFDAFELRAIGNTCEIWVQVDLNWSAGDPRTYPNVTDAQINYLLSEFENNILPTTSTYFGEPDFHNGTYSLLEAWGYVPPGYYDEENGKNVILVSNIRDDNYYDYSYPYYIAGFYSPTFEAYFDRNIISMDSYDWENRIGPDVSKPYTYEGLIAHEYQHLIHDDYNPADDLFMNEACSMFAEMLCGYGIDSNAINSYLYTPDNSLTEWEDQGGINVLADYGAAQLWATYLNDQYGDAFLGYFVQAGVPGVEGINNALNAFKSKDDFSDVFHNWKLANLIHSDTPGGGKYNYETIDFDTLDSIRVYEESGLPVSLKNGSDYGNTITILGYDTGVAKLGPYGSDYIKLYDWETPGSLLFDGNDEVEVTGWTQDNGEWYSGAENMMDALIFGEAYVNETDPTLSFNTYWDIEDYWDFGFVQVSTDGGSTWTSLENEYTTYDHDPSAHPDIVANLPGLTSWSCFVSASCWVDMEFNLSAYAGQNVLVGFRYMTDWATLYQGWNVSDVTVSGEILELAPFTPEADFQATLVLVIEEDGEIVYVPQDLKLDDGTEAGNRNGNKEPKYAILVVSSVVEDGWVDYSFEAISLKGRGR